MVLGLILKGGEGLDANTRQAGRAAEAQLESAGEGYTCVRLKPTYPYWTCAHLGSTKKRSESGKWCRLHCVRNHFFFVGAKILSPLGSSAPIKRKAVVP